MGSIPGWGTKIPHAARYGQKIKKKKKLNNSTYFLVIYIYIYILFLIPILHILHSFTIQQIFIEHVLCARL